MQRCGYRNLLLILSTVIFIPATSGNSLAGFVLDVDSKSDLSNAGRSVVNSPYTPPDLVLLPAGIDLPKGENRWIEFSSVTGVVNAGPGWPDVGPDGGTQGPGPTFGTNIFSYNGISGIVADRFLFLAGVFLTDDQPTAGTEPDRLDFRSIGTNFQELSPAISQSFFIGDGRTSTGEIQRFRVPDTATRFYIGFLDSYDFGWVQGGDLPYAYWDNTGSLKAEFGVYAVPAPSTLISALIASGVLLGLLALRGRLLV
jgi:hypothetical protein